MSFYIITLNFLMLFLLHKILKGSRNIQGFALIREVLFLLMMEKLKGFESNLAKDVQTFQIVLNLY